MRRWSIVIVVLAVTVCGVTVAFDRAVAREKLVDYRVRSQNLHIDHLEHEMDKLENRFGGLSEPIGMWDIRMLAARLRRGEGRKCKGKEVNCGGDYPECVSSLFVCDGHVDCRNGRDEDERICNADPVQVGRTYQGVMHWDSCQARIDHNLIITITHIYRAEFFRNRVYLRATISSDTEETGRDDPILMFAMKGYYAFAMRTLVLLPTDPHHTYGVMCEFHFGDNEHADCAVKEVASLHECGKLRVVRG